MMIIMMIIILIIVLTWCHEHQLLLSQVTIIPRTSGDLLQAH
jgi:hypothetical protein